MTAVIPALADRTAAAMPAAAETVAAPAPAGDARLHDLAMPPVELAAPIPDRAAWRASVAAALAAHLAVLVVVAGPAPERTVGGGGADLEAISVDVVSALALDARDAAIPTLASAAPMAAIAEVDGADEAKAAAVASPDLNAERQPNEKAKTERADIAIPDAVIEPAPPEPNVPGIVIAPTTSVQTAEGPERPVPIEPKPEVAARSSAPAEASQEQAIGGVAARGFAAPAAPASAAALASPGDLAAYERRLQQAIAKVPPRLSRTLDNRGDVTIRFAIAAGGTLAYARIEKSSGKPHLDEAALTSVRRAQLPSPPPGQHPYYLMPFKFR